MPLSRQHNCYVMPAKHPRSFITSPLYDCSIRPNGDRKRVLDHIDPGWEPPANAQWLTNVGSHAPSLSAAPVHDLEMGVGGETACDMTQGVRAILREDVLGDPTAKCLAEISDRIGSKLADKRVGYAKQFSECCKRGRCPPNWTQDISIH